MAKLKVKPGVKFLNMKKKRNRLTQASGVKNHIKNN